MAIVGAILLLLGPFSAQAIAEDGEIILYPGDEPRRIMGSMLLVDSASHDLTSTEGRRTITAKFSTLAKTITPRFAMIEPTRWLLAALVNASEQSRTYILDTEYRKNNLPFPRLLRVLG